MFLDQLSKYLTVLYLKPVGTFPILQDALHLTYVENRGAAFGMLADSRWVFMVVSAVSIVALSVYLIRKKPKSRLLCLSLAFVIGGGIGNMIDRVALGYVVDMIDFRLIHFAVFMRREVLAERAAAAAQPQDPAEEAHPDAPAPDETAADTTAPEGQRSDTTDSRSPTDRPPDGGAPDA